MSVVLLVDEGQKGDAAHYSLVIMVLNGQCSVLDMLVRLGAPLACFGERAKKQLREIGKEKKERMDKKREVMKYEFLEREMNFKRER